MKPPIAEVDFAKCGQRKSGRSVSKHTCVKSRKGQATSVALGVERGYNTTTIAVMDVSKVGNSKEDQSSSAVSKTPRQRKEDSAEH